MKKLLSLLLALSLICAFSAGSFMFAAGSGNPVIKVASVETLKNSSASVAVTVQSSPGVTALKITVAFPEDLTLSSVQFDSGLGERVMVSPTLESPVILNWFDGLNDYTGDFAFATLNFDIAADAVTGDKAITVSYNADDVANIDGDEVAFEVESGKITVIDCKHPSTEIHNENVSEPTCTAEGSYDEVCYCTVCEEELSRTHKTVPMLEHTLGGWVSDDQNHWKVCGECKGFYESAPHVESTWFVDYPAEIGVTGHQHTECTVCGIHLREEDIPALLDHTPGDVDGNAEVDNRDLLLLFKHLTGHNDKVNESALDVNGDGVANNKDFTRLFRYLSDCDVMIY